jgi:hypothetical protein
MIVTGQINNNSAFTLTLSSSSLQWGEWNANPPATIAPNSTGSFVAQGTDGTATGTQGTVNYTIDGQTGMVVLSFEDPFSGSNSGSGSSSIVGVSADGSIGSGDAVTATYNIS